jgi:hypothetical protein
LGTSSARAAGFVTAATSHMSLKEKEIAGYVTDSGGPSINKKALRDLADLALAKADEQGADRARLLARADRFVAYADFASLVKTISTDIPLLSQRPIHTFFDSLKETGRIGSSKPNITNLPRREGVRECFVPRAGCCFVSADYGGIELYTWAEVCEALLRQSTLAEELRAGLDPHLVVASDILSKPYDWCLMNKKAVDLERQTGKVLNFGAPGGVGAARLAFAAKNQYGVDLTAAGVRTPRHATVSFKAWPRILPSRPGSWSRGRATPSRILRCTGAGSSTSSTTRSSWKCR